MLSNNSSINLKVFICIVLAALCLVTFAPLFTAGYMDMDDSAHFLNNPLISPLSTASIPEIFLTPDTVNFTYIPLTVLSFYIEASLFGFNPAISHAINIFLHFLVVLMVVVLGRRLGLSLIGAFVAALVFAIHPMHVESVAWVTERKDLLYSFFYLCSLVFYCIYTQERKGYLYIISLCAAALSILSKPMALSLPLVLFLIDQFKERKFTCSVLLEKVPYFILIIPIAGITYIMNIHPGIFDIHTSPLVWIYCASFYLQKFLIPVGLQAIYYMPTPVNLTNTAYLAGTLVFLTAIISFIFTRRNKWAVLAILFYAASTFFLWRFEGTDVFFVADRFMYLPSLGICFLAGYYFQKAVNSSQRIKWAATIVVACLTAMLVSCSSQRTTIWKNSFYFWNDLYQANRSDNFASSGMALCVLNNPDYQLIFFKRNLSHLKVCRSDNTIRASTDCASRKSILVQLKAYKLLKKAYLYMPRNTLTLMGLIAIENEWENYNKVIYYSSLFLKIESRSSFHYYVRSLAYYNLGQYRDSLLDLNRAISLSPSYFDAYLIRAKVNLLLNELRASVLDSIRALELRPNNPVAYDQAIKTFLSVGDSTNAALLINQELRIFPMNKLIHEHQQELTFLLDQQRIPKDKAHE